MNDMLKEMLPKKSITVDRKTLIDFIDDYVEIIEGEWGSCEDPKETPFLRLRYAKFYEQFNIHLTEDGKIGSLI